MILPLSTSIIHARAFMVPERPIAEFKPLCLNGSELRSYVAAWRPSLNTSHFREIRGRREPGSTMLKKAARTLLSFIESSG
jgi:hypothetical protein